MEVVRAVTYRLKIPRQPSRREIRNTLQGLDALANGTTPSYEAPVKRRGKQEEGLTNDAIGMWRKMKSGLVLERNKRRLATPVGYDRPILLGWLSPGSPDWIGYQSLVITEDMVGKRIAAFVGIEAKRPSGGVLSDEQESWLNDARDAGAIVGVARNAEEAELILARWREGRTR